MHNHEKIGKVLHHFPFVESTNDTARQLLSKTTPSSGTVIIADFQTKGRGQRENNWESEPKANLLCSIILLPEIDVDDYFYLNKIVCIAIVEMLNTLIPNEKIEIKWPNDILINKKKVAGILIENAILNTLINQSIVGIGLNVNQSNFTLASASSLRQYLATDTDPLEIAQLLFASLDMWYQNLRSKKHPLIDSIYCKLLYGYATEIAYKIDNLSFTGQICQVYRDGSIDIKNTQTSSITRYYFKQISFLL